MYVTKINGVTVEKRVLTEKVATLADVKMIADFQQLIRAAAIKAKNGEPVFAADDEEFISEIITSKDGEVMLYFDGDVFVGISELTIPDDKSHMEEYLVTEYKPETDYSKMGVFESVAIIPEYQGNGLQLQITERMHERAKSKGIKWMTGTVHPENPYSRNNFAKAGYEFLDEVDFHYGRRLIVFKEL